MKTLKKQKKGTVTLSKDEAKAAYHALCYYYDTLGDGRMTKDGMDFSWENVANLVAEFAQLAEELQPQ